MTTFPPISRVVRNVMIATTGNDRIAIDVYASYAPGINRPAVVFLHGGGFVGGDKDQFLAAASYLALTEDALCLTVSYRTAPRHRFPAPVEDCRAACDWLYARRDEFGIAPDRMVLVGGSPGANIAALAMLFPAADCFIPRNAVLLNGIMDMTDFYDRNPEEQERVRQYLGMAERNVPQLKKASPCEYAGPGFTMLFLHGEEDAIVPLQQSRDMAHALAQSGSRAKLTAFPGEGHAWFNAPDKQFAVWSAIAAFLQQQPKE